MRDVAIVGAGLFGSIIARALRNIGMTVTVYDDNRPEAGSKPAACLMKPGWFSSLGKDVYDPALDLLDELYGLKEVTFTMRPSGITAKVFWVPPDRILHDDIEWERVTHLGQLDARVIIVAAGIWTEMLVPEVKQKAQAGVAFLWPYDLIEEPFVQLWAPYKQIVGFNRGDGLWVSDGTAILRHNWTSARTDACLARCRKSVYVYSDPPPPKQLFGIRPYHEMKPCYLAEVRPRLWVATGGAKNGTLAAAWAANELVKRFS